MLKTSLAASALMLSVAAFGLGFIAGSSHEPANEPPKRVVRGDPLPPDGVAAAVAATLTNADTLKRTAELAALLSNLGPDALTEVRTAFDAVFVTWGDIEVILLAQWWAGFDPQAAWEWSQRELIGKHPSVVATAVRTWAARDPEGAREMVATIASPDQRRASTEALISGWEESGQPGLLDYVAQLPYGAERQTTTARMARRMVLRDGIEATIRWAEQIPDDAHGKFKLHAYRRVASALAEVDPHKAAAWAERHSDGKHGDGLFRRVGSRWAKQDGPAAMRWLAGLPAGEQRDIGVEATYRSWLAADPEGALAWMRAGENTEWREPALMLFALYISREQPSEALDWAARIADPERREETTIKVGQSWRSRDPEAAQEWLDRAELSEAARERINQPLRTPGQMRGPGQAGAQ